MYPAPPHPPFRRAPRARAAVAMHLRPRPFLLQALAPLHISRGTLSVPPHALRVSRDHLARRCCGGGSNWPQELQEGRAAQGIRECGALLPAGSGAERGGGGGDGGTGVEHRGGAVRRGRAGEGGGVREEQRARDCPKDDRPEFAVLGRSNVGKSSLINALICRKEAALTSKKPGKTQTINHFLINKSWCLVDLPGYGLAAASQSARMDWSSFTKGYFLNRDTLVGVLLLVDASIPPQKIDLDCANWLGRNNIGLTFVFTKCDKAKKGKGGRPDDNINVFQETISELYPESPPWIMASSATGLLRDGVTP